jgi:hypothetical protein
MLIPVPELSDDDAAQVCIMASVLPTEAALKGEPAALLALHRLRFPAGDVARLGRAAAIRAASQRNGAFGALPTVILATPAAAHARAFAAEIATLDNDATWMKVAIALGILCLSLFGALAVQILAIGADILREKSKWDFEDGEEVVTPPKGWPGGGWLTSEERERR